MLAESFYKILHYCFPAFTLVTLYVVIAKIVFFQLLAAKIFHAYTHAPDSLNFIHGSDSGQQVLLLMIKCLTYSKYKSLLKIMAARTLDSRTL